MTRDTEGPAGLTGRLPQAAVTRDKAQTADWGAGDPGPTWQLEA